MKKYTILKIIALAALVSEAYAGVYVPEGSWNRVRLYGHAGNRAGFTNQDYVDIRNNFSLFTIEKSHAHQIYGLGTSEQTTRIASDEMNRRRAAVRTLFYWNADVAWTDFYVNLTQTLQSQPSWYNKTSISPSDYVLTFPNTASENNWVNVAASQVNNSQSEGVFIDAVGRAENAGHLSIVERMMDRLPGLVIYNGYYVTPNNTVLAGARTLNHADGVFVEFFCTSFVDTTPLLRTQLNELLKIPATKYIICRSAPDSTFGNTHDFSLAAYLIVANSRSFYTFSDDYMDAYPEVYDHIDFRRRLGPPNGPATVIGNDYIRSFRYADVNLNIATKRSNIVWK